MSRKAKLMHQCEKYIFQNRKGSVGTRKERKRVLSVIVNDLISLRIAPDSFSDIDQAIMLPLVSYWKEKLASDKTIANRLGIFRNFMAKFYPNVDIPKNKNFGIFSNPSKRGMSSLPYSIQEIRDSLHPLTRTILDFQLYFGLTKTESIRLKMSSINERQQIICVNRNISTNNHDRYIPLTTEEQNQTIMERKKFLLEHGCLTGLAPLKDISALYKTDCLIKKIPYLFPYRSYYAKSRFRILSKKTSSESAIGQLRQELGLASIEKIQELIRNDSE